MTSAVFKIVKLKKWFPDDDPLAAKVARLCILREDFLLEAQGVRLESIKELDEHSESYRRAYFFRRLTLTLNELASAINGLLCTPEFKALLEKQPAEIQAHFSNLGRRMHGGQTITKDVRNAICGHVKETEVRAALERIDPDAFGFYEATPIADKTHMKFAGELVSEILLSGVSPQDRANISASKFEKVADMFVFLFPLTRLIFVMYAKHRGLL